MKEHGGGRKGMAGMVILVTMLLAQGCSNRGSSGAGVKAPLPESEQGVLGDLNRYVWQLAGQQTAGNAQAGKTLVRLMNGQGLPEPVRIPAGKTP